jgi:uncharacterized protein
MNPLFADASYFVAMLSSSDAAHTEAEQWSHADGLRAVTTEFVLIEVANIFRDAIRRRSFRELLDELGSVESQFEVIPASTELFRAGADLYLQRPDKEWSLTDCISFVVMEERGLTEALTTDHHFKQAGFRALLR